MLPLAYMLFDLNEMHSVNFAGVGFLGHFGPLLI